MSHRPTYYAAADRFASIYASPMPGYRDGPSTPVSFYQYQNEYRAPVWREGWNHEKRLVWLHKPHRLDGEVLTLEAGQGGSGYSAVVLAPR